MKLTQQHLLVQQQSQHPLQQQQQQQQQAQRFPDSSEGQMQQPLSQLTGQLSHMNGGHLAYPVQGPGRDAVPITVTAATAAPAGPSQMTPSSTQQLLAQQQQQQLIAQRGLLQHLQQQQLQKQQLQQQLPVDIMKPPQLMQHQQHVRQRRLQLQQLQQQQQQLQQQQLQLLRTPESPGLYSAFCRLLQQLSLHRMSLRDARVRVLLVVLRWLQQQQQQQTEPSRLFRDDQFERLVKQTRAYMRLLLLQQPLKEDELLQLGLSPALGFKPNREFIAAVAASAEVGTNYKPPAPKEQHQQRPRSHQLFVQLYEQQLQQHQQRALEALEQQTHKYEEVARLRLEKEEQQQHQEEQQQQLQEQRQQPGTSKDNALHTCLDVGGSSEEQRHQLLEKHMRKQQQVDTKESKREDDAALHSSNNSCCAAEAAGAAQVASSTALTEEESDADGFLSSSDEWWGVGGLECPVDDGNSGSMQERARISRLQRRLLILAPFQKQIREEVVAQRITESPAQLPPLQHLPVRLARKHRALRLLRERGDRMTAARQQQQQQRQQVLQQLFDSHRRTFLQQQRDVLRQLRRVAAAVKRKKTAAADGGEGAASCGHPLHPTDCGCPGAAAVAAQMRKERLDALRKHDEAGYLKLLQETKNERLLQLVRQTEGYMQQIGSLVVEQREREGINVPSTEEETDGAAEEASGSLSSSFLFSKERYYRITHSQREKVTELPSCLKGGTLRPYQMEGLNWLVSLHNNGLNGILADCMGLGKTVQTVSFLAYLYEKKGVRNPHLILAPLSTLHGNWRLEFKKWWPSLRIVVYEGAKDVRKALRSRIVSGVRVEGSGQETQRFLEPLFDVLLTTDAFVLRDKSFLKKIQWEYLIVDEAHRLKNPNSKLVQTLNSGFSIRRRIALTGTPLQNDIVEVWALLNFLMPSIFNAKLNFEQWLNVPLGAAPLGGPAGAGGDDQPHAITVTEEEKLLIIDRLHKVLRPFLLRREKAEVANELPSKQEEIVWCPLSGIQRILYRIIEESPMGHNRMVQLRKVCNHPFLFCFSSFTPDESLVRCCGKFAMLDVLLPALKAAQHRVLVFSQMTKLLDLLEAYLSLRGYRYLRLDGGTSSEERQTRLALYNQENSPYFLFILSTKAGGLGVNLQSADTVIIFDSDWNPQNDEQAQSRAHRIGQKREVLTIRFVTPSSVEEQILHSAELKLDKDALVIKSGMYNGELQDRETERQEQVREILRRRKQLEANLTRPFDFAILKNQLSRNPAESRVFDALQKIRQLLHIPGLIYGEAVPPCLFRWSKTVERSQTDLVENTAQAAQDWKIGYALSDFWTTQRKKKQPPAATMSLQLVGGSVSPLLPQPIASAALASLPSAASAPAGPPAATADPAQQEGCASLALQQSQLQLEAHPQSHMQVQQQCQQQQERQQEQLKQVLHAPEVPSAFLTASADGNVTHAVDDAPAAAASASGTQGESITGNLEKPLLAVATGTVQVAGPSLGGTSEPATVAGGAEVGMTRSDSKQRSFGAEHADQSSVRSAAPGGGEVTPEASVLAGGTTAEPSEVTEAGLGSIEAACTTAAVEGVASNPETSDGAAAASTGAVLDRLSSCGTSPLTGSAAPSVVANFNTKHPSAGAATTAAKAESTVAADAVVVANAGGRDSSSVAGGPGVRGIPGGSSGCVDLWGCGEGQEGDSAGAAAACLADPQRWRALLNGAISQALTEAIQESRFSAFVELPSPTVYKDYYECVSPALFFLVWICVTCIDFCVVVFLTM
ncbi:transcription regulatory protein SNF2, putative [Eimeria tenella]|uniref:Transcription regulatory protein SNF2, putative n=1 Tax=Eimeria tenella TaxID=5802 RepID=U6KGF4_EIMTE|nr:transcription regulatory protein SNF2, putative [Eimeria tenella]CDJ37034.1 transcription regulatory protein SNF2, putative [Eimeria tenella]|eukprot:XP_013227872.1 transcription regulatory protein SNF2, putative [Eimeria tenella]